VRVCLAVAGGLRIPEVLGSAATDLRAGFGGFCGRALAAGDKLEFGEAGRTPRCGDWHVGREEPSRQIELRFLPGVQETWFSDEARRRFREEIYQLTPNSDRMGARLRDDHVVTASAVLAGNARFGGGRLRVRLGYVQGLDILGMTARGDPLASRSDGGGPFSKLEFWTEYERSLGRGFGLDLRLAGQLASRPLLASEEMGWPAVRAAT
jgi:hypothetical protein